MPGEADEAIRKLRHDIANPLGALLTEVQLLLMDADKFDPDTQAALRQMETLARQMKDILARSRT